LTQSLCAIGTMLVSPNFDGFGNTTTCGAGAKISVRSPSYVTLLHFETQGWLLGLNLAAPVGPLVPP